MKSRDISMEQHKKELTSYISIPILINRDSYGKLIEIAEKNKNKKPPEKIVEGFIDDMYYYLKTTGDL